ncbi:ABC-type branched-chain amino acid transport system, ATPase component [Candidatus Terasakiella magnetica]|uniref:ABC-type branched-chain amino acid transport system, ATPase component n=1 Tax=Candidatus Terasakiella magnetica TaxID=1867952 RepID=A0A1C3RFF4_9PROT|nr:ATP-binding cassette domain-containing protein [Candidatus Terasakiella magnetica]SCA56026.1 ABC-type branched-chain amino acid transport system, ATPase component [Candidatus Terasakiella magnetica]
MTDDLSFSLNKGEALGVIGPNGAGKSTMFNLITGDVNPDVGNITFDGQSIVGIAPANRCHLGIGRSYQIPHPFVGMTVFENLLVGGSFGAGMAESEAYDLCVETLERTGLLAKANQTAGSLSLLDRKRLELARALSTKPNLLLLDEIAGGLTEHEVHELIETINEIRLEGVSIIWIEHIVHALLAVVDRLIAINFGQLLTQGDPASVMASPEVQEVYMGMSEE